MNYDIKMVDLQKQYQRLKSEIDAAMQEVVDTTAFVKGPQTRSFEANLASYLNTKNVIACGNGTDALQIALMALDLNAGDEIIVPDFTFIASAEVIALMGFQPVFVASDSGTYNMKVGEIEKAITPKTKAIIPVHLFGQCVDMEPIIEIAKKYKLWVIEDNAQAIGADYTFTDGRTMKAGTMGDIGTTSFFPSKNLGCYGDGGAVYTNNDALAKKMRAVANHGMEERYYHKYIGVNSRLDSIQAAVLDVKLKQLDDFNTRRRTAADFYDTGLAKIEQVQTPVRAENSSHVFHQYTLQVENRDELRAYLTAHKIPAMVYYPVPLHKQEAFTNIKCNGVDSTQKLCDSVLSLPMHTELSREEQDYIVSKIKDFYSHG